MKTLIVMLLLASTTIYADDSVFIPPVKVQHATGGSFYRALVNVDDRIFSMCLPERERAIELLHSEIERYYQARHIEVVWSE